MAKSFDVKEIKIRITAEIEELEQYKHGDDAEFCGKLQTKYATAFNKLSIAILNTPMLPSRPMDPFVAAAIGNSLGGFTVGIVAGMSAIEKKKVYDSVLADFNKTQAGVNGALEEIAHWHAVIREFIDNHPENDNAMIEDKAEKEPQNEILCEKRREGSLVNKLVMTNGSFVVGLKPDGSAMLEKINPFWEKYINVIKGWDNLKAVATSSTLVAGLDFNGKVHLKPTIGDKKARIPEWKNVRDISGSGGNHIAGLYKDGTVFAFGLLFGKYHDAHGECETSQWRNIIAVSAGSCHTVGLKADGTVVAVGMNEFGQCNVSSWKDIVSISAADTYTVGIHKSGKVFVAGVPHLDISGHNREGFNVSTWHDIVSVSTNNGNIIGVMVDGTVVAAGANFGKYELSGWKNIVAVSAGPIQMLGLRSDGTVLMKGENSIPLIAWKLFDDIETVKKEIESADIEWNKKIQRLKEEKRQLEQELSEQKGLFSGKRRREIKARLNEIEDIL